MIKESTRLVRLSTAIFRSLIHCTELTVPIEQTLSKHYYLLLMRPCVYSDSVTQINRTENEVKNSTRISQDMLSIFVVYFLLCCYSCAVNLWAVMTVGDSGSVGKCWFQSWGNSALWLSWSEQIERQICKLNAHSNQYGELFIFQIKLKDKIFFF